MELPPKPEPLDVNFVRQNFPAFSSAELSGSLFFENAGGSYACADTVNALHDYYKLNKVQPYAAYNASKHAGEAMDQSRRRWAEALGVETDEVNFGPSTSMNTYVLANAFGAVIGPGDEVIVTNQDHEANTGAVRRMAERVGATLLEWRIDPESGLLDIAELDSLLTDKTKLMTFPHCSNIIGAENDVAAISAKAHQVGARVIVDGVSFAPHTFPDVAAMGADVYLFSMYKTYSVHQGLMVLRNGVAGYLPNQGHYFNRQIPTKRLTPAGPDHAQEAAAGAVLDYVETLGAHHRVMGGTLRETVASVSSLWRAHEAKTLAPVIEVLSAAPGVRLLGPAQLENGLHRCPTVAFVPGSREPSDVAGALVDAGIMCSSGGYYANRVLEGLGVDPDTGVVRLSWVHYTSDQDISTLVKTLERVLGLSA